MPTRPQLKSNKKLVTRNNKQKPSGYRLQVTGYRFARGLPFRSPERSRRITNHLSLAHKAPGQVLILAFAFLTVILVLSAALFGKVANYVSFGKINADSQQATFLAEAGVDYALWKFNTGLDPNNTTISIGSAQFSISVTTPASDQKSITSTGCIPNCTNAKTKRTIKISAQEGSNTFPLTGAAFVNGSLTMDPEGGETTGPTINGDVFTNGPITINQGTINGNLKTSWDMSFWKSWICSHVTGTCKDKLDGITSQPMPAPVGWNDKSVEDATSPYPAGDYIKQCTASRVTYSLGPAHITGKLDIDGCDLLLRGPVWVDGEVKIHGSANVRLDPAFFPDAGTVIMSDSKISVWDTYTSIEKLTDPLRYIILWSRVNSTVNNAMVGGDPLGGAFGADGGFWYAPGGKVLFQGHTDIVAVAAQELRLVDDTTKLNYEIGLGQGEYSLGTGSTSSWILQKGTYQYVN